MFARQLSFNQLTAGFSLLEVLLAFFISILAVTFLTHHYLQRHHYYLLDTKRTQHEVNALNLYHLFQDEVERAGHIGCAKLSSSFQVIPYHQYTFTHENTINVTDNSLEVRYLELPTSRLLQSVHNGKLSVTNDIVVKKDDVMLIADCEHAEIFSVASVESHGDAIILYTKEPLHNQYAESAEVGRYISHRYFLMHDKSNHCLVRESQSGWHDTISCQVTDLTFLYDKKGVEYQFELSKLWWSGYAVPAA